MPEQADPDTFVSADSDVGRYWTLDRAVALGWAADSAYSEHEVPDGIRIVLEAVISSEMIDIDESAAVRIGAPWEAEIRLREGTRVAAVNVERLDDIAPGCTQ